MKFEKTKIAGVYIIQKQLNEDKRGYFARAYCYKEMLEFGISFQPVQINISQNKKKGTLRGLHMQNGQAAEEKIVSCIRGSVYDVCVDLREGSHTYGKYVAYILSELNGNMLYIPKGCAHGFMTLEDDTQMLYFMSEFYAPEYAVGYRYDDPFFGIEWPDEKNKIISERDRSWEYIVE